jgi:hypothetical protein
MNRKFVDEQRLKFLSGAKKVVGAFEAQSSAGRGVSSDLRIGTGTETQAESCVSILGSSAPNPNPLSRHGDGGVRRKNRPARHGG